jgi:hypothetical protein
MQKGLHTAKREKGWGGRRTRQDMGKGGGGGCDLSGAGRPREGGPRYVTEGAGNNSKANNSISTECRTNYGRDKAPEWVLHLACIMQLQEQLRNLN